MRNYYFNPNGYDDTYVILAESAEDALRTLRAYIKTCELQPRRIEKWDGATIDNLPGKYTIEVYGPRQVIEGYIW